MTILKRLKNIWALGALDLTAKTELPTMQYNSGKTNPRPMATIIKLTPKDDIDEALTQINEEKNG